MSEYQYYEFLAVDKPLTAAQVEGLRRYSSRAEISTTSFRNHYEWGDFRGNVDDFLARYFDLHVYVANWGTHTFALALPTGALDLPLAKPYAAESTCEIASKKNRFIITFTSREEEGDWESDGGEWMARLAPLREELLQGDLRVLYLVWLAGVQEGIVDEGDCEPPIPPNLKKLTAAQQAFAEFMRIDDELVEVAAECSSDAAQRVPDFRQWLATVALQEKDDLLLAVVDGRGAEVARELRTRLRKFAPSASSAAPSTRTAGAMTKIAGALEAEKRRIQTEKAARERARKAAEAVAARQEHLSKIAPQREQIWNQVEQLIATTIPKNYDQAVHHLFDLRDLAVMDDLVSFSARFSALRQKHAGKPSLQKRLYKVQI